MKQTCDKNKRFFGIKAVLAMTMTGILLCGTAFASSKSTSVQVSCSIQPMMALAAASSVSAVTNLGHQYQMSESLVDRGSQKIKIYSLTAL